MTTNPANTGTARTAVVDALIRDASRLAPVMTGSFTRYHSHLKAYLSRFGAWGLLNGTIVRHATNATDQDMFDMLLRGVKIDDAERMCELQSAKQM